MSNADWRVEAYRGMDVYVLVSSQRDDGVATVGDVGQWRYEVRVCQEGADPSDAGDTERLSGDGARFATRHAAEVAAFSAAYHLVDRLLGPVEG
ncbi:hypothetical protein P3W85_30775 [Cupriavidus basilensis]|uniref:Uncharacterized protein n=1 Tax=Cupriavidus basilensis TaxID=68895 RepID=A0ABT6AXF0_9BURK|nr:hypothetical protein [Cupriavidus basilensis]MDF3837302.1 hypothetical protein [Cupriavidus basilensis]